MQDRVPAAGQAGRVLITPENGSAPFYATISMADNPTQPGTPYNVANILQDASAQAYGLTAEAVPNDMWMRLLPMIFGQGRGGLLVEGPPGVAISISGPDDFSLSGFIGANTGLFVCPGAPGEYAVEITPTGFYSMTGSTEQSAEIIEGQSTVVSFGYTRVLSGTLRFETSGSVVIPGWVDTVDLFAVGGGASGQAEHDTGGTSGSFSANGGGGGFTKTLLAQPLAGKTLEITVGAGGPRYTGGRSADGNDGGNTRIHVDGSEIMFAVRGYFNHGLPMGGSGGGVASNRSPGGTDGGGRDGQGTTTRAFGEPDGELFSGGGGAVDFYGNTSYVSAPGSPGGGTAASGGSYADAQGGDATGIGSGGGAAGTADPNDTAISGAGMHGIVLVRWEVQE